LERFQAGIQSGPGVEPSRGVVLVDALRWNAFHAHSVQLEVEQLRAVLFGNSHVADFHWPVSALLVVTKDRLSTPMLRWFFTGFCYVLCASFGGVLGCNKTARFCDRPTPIQPGRKLPTT